jgi:hypothetical protein
MRRHRNRIPPVRTWRVRYYDQHNVLMSEVFVGTINKRFAKWLARERNWLQAYYAHRTTVSLVD